MIFLASYTTFFSKFAAYYITSQKNKMYGKDKNNHSNADMLMPECVCTTCHSTILAGNTSFQTEAEK